MHGLNTLITFTAGNTTGSDIFVTGDQVEPNELYMCTAEHAAGSSTITFNINTIGRLYLS